MTPDTLVVEPVSVVPGQRATATFQLTNRGSDAVTWHLAVAGLPPGWVELPATVGPVAPRTTVSGELTLTLPLGHPAAELTGSIVATPDHATGGADRRRVEADLAVTIESALSFGVRLDPQTARGRRVARSSVVLENRGPTPLLAEVEPTSTPELRVALRRRRVVVPPGGSAQVRLRVTGPRPLVGGSVTGTFGVVVTGRGRPQLLNGTVVRRAVVPPVMTKVLAVAAVVAVWAAVAGYGITNLSKHLHTAATARAAASAPVPPPAATPSPSGSGTTSGGATNGGAAGSGASGGAGGGAAGAAGSTTTARVIGKVTATDPSGVAVTVTPTSLVDESALGATHVGPGSWVQAVQTRALTTPIGKVYGTLAEAASPVGGATPATGALLRTSTAPDGGFVLAGLPAPGEYLVTLAKAGYTTGRYIVSATGDGQPLKLEAALSTGDGSLSGAVTDASGAPLGGVALTISDGAVSVQAATPTVGSVGAWSVRGLSTPGTYLVTATKAGYGTQTATVTLGAGGTASGVGLAMTAGVASLTGTVTSARDAQGAVTATGATIGGLTVSVTDGATTTRRTTTLTTGPVGAFTLPNLPIPATYTVTVSGDGYVSQSQRLVMTSNATVAPAVVPASADVHGVITEVGGAAIPGAGVALSDGKLTYKALTATDGTVGAYDFGQVAPGAYLLSVSSYRFGTESTAVVVAAGDVRRADLALGRLPAAVIRTGGIQGQIVDQTTGAPVTSTGAVLSLDGAPLAACPTAPAAPAAATVAATSSRCVAVTAAEGSYLISGVPAGLHKVVATVPGYEDGSVEVTVPVGQLAFAPALAVLALDDLGGAVISQASHQVVAAQPGDSPAPAALVQVDVFPANAAPASCPAWGSPPGKATVGTVVTSGVPALSGAGVAASSAGGPADGYFEVDGLVHGNYRLCAVAKGYEPLPAPQPVTLQPGQPTLLLGPTAVGLARQPTVSIDLLDGSGAITTAYAGVADYEIDRAPATGACPQTAAGPGAAATSSAGTLPAALAGSATHVIVPKAAVALTPGGHYCAYVTVPQPAATPSTTPGPVDTAPPATAPATTARHLLAAPFAFTALADDTTTYTVVLQATLAGTTTITLVFPYATTSGIRECAVATTPVDPVCPAVPALPSVSLTGTFGYASVGSGSAVPTVTTVPGKGNGDGTWTVATASLLAGTVKVDVTPPAGGMPFATPPEVFKATDSTASGPTLSIPVIQLSPTTTHVAGTLEVAGPNGSPSAVPGVTTAVTPAADLASGAITAPVSGLAFSLRDGTADVGPGVYDVAFNAAGYDPEILEVTVPLAGTPGGVTSAQRCPTSGICWRESLAAVEMVPHIALSITTPVETAPSYAGITAAGASITATAAGVPVTLASSTAGGVITSSLPQLSKATGLPVVVTVHQPGYRDTVTTIDATSTGVAASGTPVARPGLPDVAPDAFGGAAQSFSAPTPVGLGWADGQVQLTNGTASSPGANIEVCLDPAGSSCTGATAITDAKGNFLLVPPAGAAGSYVLSLATTGAARLPAGFATPTFTPSTSFTVPAAAATSGGTAQTFTVTSAAIPITATIEAYQLSAGSWSPVPGLTLTVATHGASAATASVVTCATPGTSGGQGCTSTSATACTDPSSTSTTPPGSCDRFAFTVNPGVYDLTFSAPNYTDVTITTPIDASNSPGGAFAAAQALSRPLVTIQGTVRIQAGTGTLTSKSADAQPMVSLTRPDGTQAAAPVPASLTDGSYTFGGGAAPLQAGTYTLQATLAGYSSSGSITVQATSSRHGEDFTLSPLQAQATINLAALAGVVGAPVGGATFTLTPTTTSPTAPAAGCLAVKGVAPAGGYQATTSQAGSTGTFGVAPDEYTLAVATLPSGLPAGASVGGLGTVTVCPGATLTTATTLQVGELTGTYTFPTGIVPVGTVATLTPTPSAAVVLDEPPSTCTTTPAACSGTYHVLAPLDPKNAASVTISMPGLSTATTAAHTLTSAAPAAPADATTLTATTVTVTLAQGSSGTPGGIATVTLTPSGGGSALTQSTTTGTATFAGLAAGTYTATASNGFLSWSGGHGSNSGTATIDASHPSGAVTLSASYGQVSGSVQVYPVSPAPTSVVVTDTTNASSPTSVSVPFTADASTAGLLHVAALDLPPGDSYTVTAGGMTAARQTVPAAGSSATFALTLRPSAPNEVGQDARQAVDALNIDGYDVTFGTPKYLGTTQSSQWGQVATQSAAQIPSGTQRDALVTVTQYIPDLTGLLPSQVPTTLSWYRADAPTVGSTCSANRSDDGRIEPGWSISGADAATVHIVGVVTWPTCATVPNVVGQTLTAATQALATAGFSSVTPAVTTTPPPGNGGMHVTTETPSAGTVTQTSTTIQLTLGP